jgi:hypothetical protein
MTHEHIAFDGNRFNRTAATAPSHESLARGQSAEKSVVSPVGIEPVLHRRHLRRLWASKLLPESRLRFGNSAPIGLVLRDCVKSGYVSLYRLPLRGRR